jgi:hypothetical protein
MAATDAMVARLRRLVDEPDSSTYMNTDLAEYIEAYPLLDVLGTDPYEVDLTTTPPTLSERDDWIPTYDLHCAARDIWEEKAAGLAENFDFKADGGSYSRSQKFEQYMAKSRSEGSRRSMKTSKLWVEPRISPSDIAINT